MCVCGAESLAFTVPRTLCAARKEAKRAKGCGTLWGGAAVHNRTNGARFTTCRKCNVAKRTRKMRRCMFMCV